MAVAFECIVYANQDLHPPKVDGAMLMTPSAGSDSEIPYFVAHATAEEPAMSISAEDEVMG